MAMPWQKLLDALDALAEKYTEESRRKRDREARAVAGRIMTEFLAAPEEVKAAAAVKAGHMPVGGGR